MAAMLQPSPMVLVFVGVLSDVQPNSHCVGVLLELCKGVIGMQLGSSHSQSLLITPTKLQQNSHMPPTTVLKWNYVSSDCSNKAETGRASQSENHYPRIKPCMGPETSTQVQMSLALRAAAGVLPLPTRTMPVSRGIPDPHLPLATLPTRPLPRTHCEPNPGMPWSARQPRSGINDRLATVAPSPKQARHALRPSKGGGCVVSPLALAGPLGAPGISSGPLVTTNCKVSQGAHAAAAGCDQGIAA